KGPGSTPDRTDHINTEIFRFRKIERRMNLRIRREPAHELRELAPARFGPMHVVEGIPPGVAFHEDRTARRQRDVPADRTQWQEEARGLFGELYRGRPIGQNFSGDLDSGD